MKAIIKGIDPLAWKVVDLGGSNQLPRIRKTNGEGFEELWT